MGVDLQEILDEFFEATAAAPMANIIVVSFFLRHKVSPIFKKLTKIYEKCMNFNIFMLRALFFYSNLDGADKSFCFMAQTNNKSERLWKFLLKYIMIGFAVNTAVTSIVSVLLCWIRNGHFDTSLVFHPYKLMFVTSRN